jgi:hypothetical protein
MTLFGVMSETACDDDEEEEEEDEDDDDEEVEPCWLVMGDEGLLGTSVL